MLFVKEKLDSKQQNDNSNLCSEASLLNLDPMHTLDIFHQLQELLLAQMGSENSSELAQGISSALFSLLL